MFCVVVPVTVRVAGDHVRPKPTSAVVVAGAEPRLAGRSVMVDEPFATPVTGTGAVVVFCATVTVAGTVAAPVLLELRLTVTPPAGAALDSVRVRFCVPVPLMVRPGGVR